MALVAKGIEYDVHDTLNPKRANPLGKLPYLELDGRGYEDSTVISTRLKPACLTASISLATASPSPTSR